MRRQRSKKSKQHLEHQEFKKLINLLMANHGNSMTTHVIHLQVNPIGAISMVIGTGMVEKPVMYVLHVVEDIIQVANLEFQISELKQLVMFQVMEMNLQPILAQKVTTHQVEVDARIKRKMEANGQTEKVITVLHGKEIIGAQHMALLMGLIKHAAPVVAETSDHIH